MQYRPLSSLRFLMAAILVAALGSTLNAQTTPTIQSAMVNYQADTLTIQGTGFELNHQPTVTVDGHNFAVKSFNATTIVTTINPYTHPIPGTFLLLVTGLTYTAQFDITVGPAGPAGPYGPQGAAGPAGSAGPAGPAGAIGATGPQGTPGAMGAIGATGPQGTPGPIGETGATGSQGAIGPVGATGAIGATGSQGIPGEVGAMGAMGATGAMGAMGATGSQGLSGAMGAMGATGSQGIPGAMGATGATGSQGPAGSNGVDGATGPAGPTGSTGATGPQGPAGSGSGLIVNDANGAAVGALLSQGYGEDLNLKSGKYFFTVGFEGDFPTGQIWWTGANCTGTPYLNDGNGGNIGQPDYTAGQSYAYSVVYSGAQNQLYVLSGGDANSVATSVNIPGGSLSIENPTCMSSVNPASGWPMTAVSPDTVGFSASGTPLVVATPLQLP
jgi:hypothetical protein